MICLARKLASSSRILSVQALTVARRGLHPSDYYNAKRSEPPARLLMVGGDHLTPVPMLRALKVLRDQETEGSSKSSWPNRAPPCLIHFDAHLDTSDSYFNALYTHGTPFRRAMDEELLAKNCSISVGIRGGLSSVTDIPDHIGLGIQVGGRGGKSSGRFLCSSRVVKRCR